MPDEAGQREPEPRGGQQDGQDWREQAPVDSPEGWVAAHIRRYDRSGGKEGQKWYGLDTLLLTTRGRTSGKARRTAVIYGRHGDRVIVVGSNAGKPEHPLWYLNLVACPEAHVQIGEEHLDVRARTATPEEKPELWALMTGIFPQYKSYQKKTTREIPVVILEPVTA
ncbi:Nitroreductase family deazaflavin-dependent oxidoreductase OS=Streptomyces tendae OX=1932 GN=F3L20_16665 PE=3 SV=1 [Streptomyces tendae]